MTTHIKSRTGLINTGNTCFINAAMQCLSVSPFIHAFINKYIEHDYKMISIFNKYDLGRLRVKQMQDYICKLLEDKNNITIEERTILEHVAKHCGDIFIYASFKEIITNLQSKKNNTISCGTLIAVAREISESSGFEHLFSGEQNDPHEFIAYILDRIHNAKSSKVIIEIPTQFKNLAIDKDKDDDNVTSYYKLYFEHLKKRYENDYSLFVKNFYYYILNCINCNKCNENSCEISPNDIMCVSLPQNWQSNDHITLDECINEMFKIEQIDYKCEKCGNNENNHIDRKLLTKPRTVIIKIKRYTQINNNIVKINKMIHYPEILKLDNYCCIANLQDYKLYAIINHIGFMGSGHYYSYIKDYDTQNNTFNNQWFLCNDSNIRPIDTDDVMNSQNAYILFYHSNN